MNTQQTPIHTGFGPRTTASDIVAGEHLQGKVAVVTGGYSGLGLEVTNVLANAGVTVIVPARDIVKAEAVLQNLERVSVEYMDLIEPDSIEAFSERFLAQHAKLDLLINCAGIMAIPLRRDRRGYEFQFSTNHLGHFHLTAHLWPALKEAGGARVVTLSSRGHQASGVRFEDLHFIHEEYNKWTAYGQSKTANVLFAYELDKRGKDYGVRAFSVHPGSIVTNLSKSLSDEEMKAMGALSADGERKFSTYTADNKTISEGAATIVWCAVSPQLEGIGGVYCENVDVARVIADDERGPGVRSWAIDPEYACRLWECSESLTGVTFAI